MNIILSIAVVLAAGQAQYFAREKLVIVPTVAETPSPPAPRACGKLVSGSGPWSGSTNSFTRLGNTTDLATAQALCDTHAATQSGPTGICHWQIPNVVFWKGGTLNTDSNSSNWAVPC